jgi:hypothetical protein
MATLNAEQKRIIRLIEQEAIKVGVDPDFAVALASLESTFRHVPADDKKSTAFGPFQVNKATAQANGVDYDEMKNSPELAVRAGVLNIARHAQNPQLGGDPMRIAAAHRLGESSEYAKTGDVSKIDTQLAGYLASAMEHFPNEEFPSAVYTPTKTESASTATEGSGSESLDMGSVPLGSSNQKERLDDEAKQEASERKLAATEVGSALAGLGAVKAPVFDISQKAYEYIKNIRNGNVTAKDFADVSNAAMKVKQQNAQAGSGTSAATVADEALLGPNAKYTAKFGNPVGVTNRELSTATGMGKGETEAWGIIKNARDANQRISNLYGEGWKLDPERQLMIDTSSGSGPRGAPRSNIPMASSVEQKAQAMKSYQDWADSVNQAQKPTDAPTKMAKSILQSTPVRWGLGGAGIGYNAEDAYQNFSKPDALNKAAGVASTGGALASALGMVPKYAARANPAAIGLTTAAQVMGDIQRGDKQAASESGLAGLTALFPRLFGPIGAAVYSGGLNKGDAEELERRRKMPPTITRP